MDNALWAGTLIDALAAGGLTRLIASPGSRSTPLTLAALRHPGVTVTMVLDERSAAFFALGLARRLNAPVAVVATSGSAPAHWLPAVIEAETSGVPLVALSADRPAELQGCGANQTIEQRDLFGGHIRAFHQLPEAEEGVSALRRLRWLAAHALEQSRWPTPGPVHLNVPLHEPLIGGTEVKPTPPLPPFEPPRLLPAEGALGRLAEALSGEWGIIVCGVGCAGDEEEDRFALAVTRLAEVLDWPILADPLSNLRFGPHDRARIITRYDTFLRNGRWAEQLIPNRVLRFGAQPVSKALAQWLEAGEAEQWVVDPHERRLDPLHRGVEWLRADPVALCDALADRLEEPAQAEWLGDYLAAEAKVEQVAGSCSVPEAALIEALRLALPDGAWLFSGNSLPIRDLDSFSGGDEKSIRILANRGASGIDGNLSTILGLAAGGEGEVVAPVVGVVGDLAFLHDLGGLLAAPGLDATIVVINNGGGAIFGHLPQAELPEFEPAWLTPHNIDLQRAAELHNLPFERVEPGELYPYLKQSLARPGVDLIEVVVDREASLAAHYAFWEGVTLNETSDVGRVGAA